MPIQAVDYVPLNRETANVVETLDSIRRAGQQRAHDVGGRPAGRPFHYGGSKKGTSTRTKTVLSSYKIQVSSLESYYCISVINYTPVRQLVGVVLRKRIKSGYGWDHLDVTHIPFEFPGDTLWHDASEAILSRANLDYVSHEPAPPLPAAIYPGRVSPAMIICPVELILYFDSLAHEYLCFVGKTSSNISKAADSSYQLSLDPTIPDAQQTVKTVFDRHVQFNSANNMYIKPANVDTRTIELILSLREVAMFEDDDDDDSNSDNDTTYNTVGGRKRKGKQSKHSVKRSSEKVYHLP